MSNGLDRLATVPGIGESCDAAVLQHLDAAHRLARWLITSLDTELPQPGISRRPQAREQEADAALVRTASAFVKTLRLRSANARNAAGLGVPPGRPGVRVSLLATIACVAIVSVVSTTVYAQAAQGSTVVVDPEASDRRVSLTNLVINLDPFTLPPAKGASPATRMAMRSDRSLQTPTSTPSGARARSKKRIVTGAIVGGVGGFFAGGFLGAHIEGDRCNCDDPGVRGFLIGAPIGAVAGGIAGARFLF